MKKIMFLDKFQLTQAVLEGRKTMTRRILKAPRTMEGKDVYGFSVVRHPRTGVPIEVMALDADGAQINNILPKYKVGEVMAVAQSYHIILEEMFDKDKGYQNPIYNPFRSQKPNLEEEFGWRNKMFVRADLMPHQIRITNVRVEKLQDISDEDCLKEGIYWDYGDYPYMATKMYKYDVKEEFIHPKAAFAALIDKISGKGTFESNPWVFVYEFELIK